MKRPEVARPRALQGNACLRRRQVCLCRRKKIGGILLDWGDVNRNPAGGSVMSGVRNDVYLHFVWSTWDRLPSLQGEAKRVAFEEIVRKAAEHHCPVMAVNGVVDHVHVLVRLATTISISNLIHDLKGASAHRIHVETGSPFRWQGGYGVFPVAPAGLDRVAEYIHNQEEHHQQKTTNAELEAPPHPPAKAPHPPAKAGIAL